VDISSLVVLNTRSVKLFKSSLECNNIENYATINAASDILSMYKNYLSFIKKHGKAELDRIDSNKDYSKWLLRMELNAETMLEKNITMDDIHFTLKNGYGNDIYCIFSDYNSDNLVFRIRMANITSPQSKFKTDIDPLDQYDQIYKLKNFQEQLLNNTIIRGIKKINKVILRKIKDNITQQSGTFKKKEIWVIDTIGTNLLDILALDFIDNVRTFSNDIMEIYNVLGIEAARQTIYNELLEVIDFHYGITERQQMEYFNREKLA
jgi:DNA-directed RNA polymerase II subunit RPB1